MNRIIIIALAAIILLGGMASAAQYRELSADTYMDKMKGGWLGQAIGVVYGGPTEFKAKYRIFEEEIKPWKPARIVESLGQDDLYVEMSFLEAIEEYGLDITNEQAGAAFADTEFPLWHANNEGRENVRKGIMPPDSGDVKNNPHCDDIDFQIEADLFGLLNPGMPQSSNAICDRFGRMVNYGDGLYGGLFVAAMYSHAFFETDIEKVIQLGLKSIPVGSTYSMCIRDVIRWHKKNPTDWRATWQLIETKYDLRPSGRCSRVPEINIDAKLNGAYIIMGLLYGDGDIEKTLEISTRCGQDSDCNPSNAMGILATIKGMSGLPEKYTSGMPAMAGKQFRNVHYTFDDVVETTAKFAREQVTRAGGSIDMVGGREVFRIPVQHPRAAKLER